MQIQCREIKVINQSLHGVWCYNNIGNYIHLKAISRMAQEISAYRKSVCIPFNQFE